MLPRMGLVIFFRSMIYTSTYVDDSITIVLDNIEKLFVQTQICAREFTRRGEYHLVIIKKSWFLS